LTTDVRTDFVGVDFLPDGNGGWVVLEVNGAVDFTPQYGFDGERFFERVLDTLMRAFRGEAESFRDYVGNFASERLHATAIVGAGATAGAER
jgi:hypothetical protein